jgi:hypothetical protein
MRAIAGAVAVALVAVGGIEGSRYWTVGRFMEMTDDAYVKADSTIVAPKVSVVFPDAPSCRAREHHVSRQPRRIATRLAPDTFCPHA